MKKILSTYAQYIGKTTIHRSELVSIQWMRGIAVMMVFIYHLEDILNLVPGFENLHSFWKAYGYSAPDLFFVISGFIMCFVTFELRFQPVGWLVRRFLRIYPIFWAFALVAVAIWTVNPEMTMGAGPQNTETILKFLLIFPQENMPLLFVTWTLEHEIVFYLLVFIIATLGGKARTVVIATGVLSVIAIAKSLLHPHYPALNFWDYHVFSLYMIQFFMGALIFELKDHIGKIKVAPALIIGGIIFVIAGQISEPMPLNQEHITKTVLFGLCHSFFLVGAINWELRKREQIGDYIDYKRRPFLVQMGDASYSIYLSHPFCLSITGKIVILAGLTGATALFGVLIGGAISLFLGWAFYHMLEKPMLHLSKDMLSLHKKKKEDKTGKSLA